MIKTVPTLGRIAVMALFALSSFGACLYLWMAFGGSSPLKPKGYRFHIAFPEATQLANQSDVRISGVTVGKVIKLEPGRGNRTETTIELKSNHLGTAREGRIDALATNVHAGRTTQVWDAVVTNGETGRTIALFRCTQSVLWPR